MKRHVWVLTTVIAIAGLFVLGGCGGPFRASQVPPGGVYDEGKVILLDRNLDPWIFPEKIRVIAVQIEKAPNGFPQVRLEVANRHGDPTSIELRTIFRDMQGLHVHTTTWKPAVVPANATYTYTAECPSKEAVDYQVQIKTLE